MRFLFFKNVLYREKVNNSGPYDKGQGSRRYSEGWKPSPCYLYLGHANPRPAGDTRPYWTEIDLASVVSHSFRDWKFDRNTQSRSLSIAPSPASFDL